MYNYCLYSYLQLMLCFLKLFQLLCDEPAFPVNVTPRQKVCNVLKCQTKSYCFCPDISAVTQSEARQMFLDL